MENGCWSICRTWSCISCNDARASSISLRISGPLNYLQQLGEQIKLAATPEAKTQIVRGSPLRLVEMTRKRTQGSLEHVMCQPCPICHARRYIKTAESICCEIFREILRQHCQFEFGELVVLAHEDVIEMLLDEESSTLAELEKLVGNPISLQTQGLNSPDQFDVVPM